MNELQIIECGHAGCELTGPDHYIPAHILWRMTRGDVTEIRCDTHAVPLEKAGWSPKRIVCDADLVSEWPAYVGVN